GLPAIPCASLLPASSARLASALALALSACEPGWRFAPPAADLAGPLAVGLAVLVAPAVLVALVGPVGSRPADPVRLDSAGLAGHRSFVPFPPSTSDCPISACWTCHRIFVFRPCRLTFVYPISGPLFGYL